MPYRNLSQFVDELDRAGMLLRVKDFVDPVYEITEITDRMSKQPGGGKAILFENNGTNFPVLTNAFGSNERVALALGIKSPDDASAQISNLVQTLTLPKENFLQKIKMLPKLRQMAKWLPKSVNGRGECQEVVDMKPSLSKLPILKCWPHDGGRFITLPMVNTLDPKTKLRNVGMYRMQVFGENVTGMHWHMHKTGARHFEEYKKNGEMMPIAVAIGGDPAYTYAATAPLPDNIDEYILAGFLRKKRVKLVKCITVDIEVPYDADFIIEGYVNPKESLVWEGPFGDHTGFYSLADWFPKFEVTCITHRRGAIYPATIVGVPPMEDAYLAKVTERIFLAPIRFALVPEINDMNLPEEGVAHNIAIVSIHKSYPGQAYKVAQALWGAGQMMFNKVMVVVNSDVDVKNPVEVLKAMALNFDPINDVLISKGPLDILDHSSNTFAFGGKILLDFTKKTSREIGESYSYKKFESSLIDEIQGVNIDGAIRFNFELVRQGYPLLIVGVNKKGGFYAKACAQSVVKKLNGWIPKIMLFVDADVDIANLSLVAWYAAGNTDTLRDCSFVTIDGKKIPCLVVDGTRKCYESDKFPRQWPNVVVSSEETIAAVDEKWSKLGLGAFIPSPSKALLGIKIGNEAMVSPFL
jgi:4-hydroxy-3-polyprenylbenzoate decarboxylase